MQLTCKELLELDFVKGHIMLRSINVYLRVSFCLFQKRAVNRSINTEIVIWLCVVGIIAGFGMGIACSGNSPVLTGLQRDKVIFMAGYKPQANLPFVAVYVAQENGYFDEQGIEVDIRHATTGEHLKLLLSGDVHFTTSAAETVLKVRSDPGAPIVAFALFGQRGMQGYMALAGQGIDELADWEGRTFGYKTSVPPDYLAMTRAGGIDRSTIQEVRVGFDPRVLTEGQVDILAIFKSNEPDTVRRLGFEVVLWDPADFGIPTMGLTYIAHTDTVVNDPNLITRFLKATMKGLEFAINNPQATLDIVMKYAPNEDPDHQAFMLETELSDAVGRDTDESGLGAMSKVQWANLYDHLMRFEALSEPFDYSTAFTTRFLEEIYDGSSLKWP